MRLICTLFTLFIISQAHAEQPPTCSKVFDTLSKQWIIDSMKHNMDPRSKIVVTFKNTHRRLSFTRVAYHYWQHLEHHEAFKKLMNTSSENLHISLGRLETIQNKYTEDRIAAINLSPYMVPGGKRYFDYLQEIKNGDVLFVVDEHLNLLLVSELQMGTQELPPHDSTAKRPFHINKPENIDLETWKSLFQFPNSNWAFVIHKS